MNYQSAGGIIFNGGKICFIRFPNGQLSFPKGTMEQGETPEQTAVREVQEETGLANPKIIKKLGVVTRYGYNHNKQVLKDIHLYLMEVEDFTQGDHDEDTEWQTPKEALPRLLPEEAKFLKTIVK